MACRELNVAVECDGKCNFLTELEPGAKENFGKENGRTLAKRSLLEKLGWKVCVELAVPRQHCSGVEAVHGEEQDAD